MRIGLYARVSTKDQNCSQQLRELREYAGIRGWEIQDEYVDHGVSGTKDSRPAMNRLMDAARRGTIDTIICLKVDRWGRSMPHFVSSLRELHGLGVRFVAVSQGIDTDESNPTSRLMINLLGAFAEFERELIVERTCAGLQRARSEGRVGGRPRVIVDRFKVAEMSAAGRTTRQIGAALGISSATVSRLLRSL